MDVNVVICKQVAEVFIRFPYAGDGWYIDYQAVDHQQRHYFPSNTSSDWNCVAFIWHGLCKVQLHIPETTYPSDEKAGKHKDKAGRTYIPANRDKPTTQRPENIQTETPDCRPAFCTGCESAKLKLLI